MTPRERILAALSHQQPDRVPFSWGFGPTGEMAAALAEYLGARGLDWHRLRAATEDILWVGAAYTGPVLPERTDIWGIRYKPVSYGAGAYGEMEHYPLAGVTTPEQIADHLWPDPTAYDDNGLRDAITESNPGRLKATRMSAGNPFEIYCWMTGLEEALLNLLTRPEVVVAALERITGFFEARLERALGACGDLADTLFFADDLGSQQGLLISNRLYREILQPFHRRLFEAAKALAPHAKVMFHSDGAVFDILPDLIDAGVEVLEAVQVDAAGMEPERLKSAFGDRLSFHGAISVQALLPRADEAATEAECRRLVQVLGAGGGYIAAPSHAIQVGTPPGNVLTMLRGVLGEEDYEGAMAEARG
jgi:uroporphyrinogen decarboxylase